MVHLSSALATANLLRERSLQHFEVRNLLTRPTSMRSTVVSMGEAELARLSTLRQSPSAMHAHAAWSRGGLLRVKCGGEPFQFERVRVRDGGLLSTFPAHSLET